MLCTFSEHPAGLRVSLDFPTLHYRNTDLAAVRCVADRFGSHDHVPAEDEAGAGWVEDDLGLLRACGAHVCMHGGSEGLKSLWGTRTWGVQGDLGGSDSLGHKYMHM